MRASTLNLLARVISGAAILGLAVLTTNVLSTTGRGIYAILTTWAGIALTIATSATVVTAADLIHGRREQRVLHGASVAIGVESALFLAVVAAGASLLTGSAILAALLWTAVGTALLIYANFEMAIAQARGDVLRVSLTDMGIAAFPLLASVAAVIFFDASVTTLVAAWAFGALIIAAILFARVAASGNLAMRGVWRVAIGLTRRSLGVAVANGSSLLCSKIDVLVVAAVLSASAAGIYSIPVALATGLLMFSRALLTATYHGIMTAPPDQVARRLGSALRHSVIVVMGAGCLSVPLVALTGGFVFGDAYSGIWEPYAILVPASAFICVAEMLRHFMLTRLERQREVVIIAVVMLVLNGVLAVAGTAAFGLIGAALSTTITYAVGAVGTLAYCSRWLSVRMIELAVPRLSDLAAYRTILRSLLVRSRSAGSVAP